MRHLSTALRRWTEWQARGGCAALLAVLAACQGAPDPTSSLPPPGALGWHRATPSATTQLSFIGESDGLIWMQSDDRLTTYEPGADRWTDHGKIPPDISVLLQSGAVIRDQLFVFGYVPQGTLEVGVINLERMALVRRPPFPLDATGIRAVVGADGRLFVLSTAGSGTADPRAQVLHVYDPATDRLHAAAPMPVAGAHSTIVSDREGRVFVVGGTTVPFCPGKACQPTPLSSLSWYDPARDAWERLPEMPAPTCDYCHVEGPIAAMAPTGVMLAVTMVEVPARPGEQAGQFHTGRIDAYEMANRAWLPSTQLDPPLIPLAMYATDDGWITLFGLTRREGQFGAANAAVTWRMRLPPP